MTAKTLLAVFGALFMVAGCTLRSHDASPPRPTDTATAFAAAASPTVVIRSSDELYDDEERVEGRTDTRFASLPVDAVLPPVPLGDSTRRVKIVLEDGSLIEGQRFGFGLLRRPGILILAQEIDDWESLSKRLAEAGFIVLAIETGGWLEAEKLETALRSLAAIDTVDAGWIAIVGAGRTADLAMLACAMNALCDAAALLSPLSRGTLLNMIDSYGGRPLWLAAADDDAEASSAALALSQAAIGETVFLRYETGRGIAALSTRPELIEQLVEWLSLNLGG